MLWGVRIMPKSEVLDSTGRVVHQALKRQNFQTVKACQVGKYIILDLETKDKNTAHNQIKEMTQQFLYNPLTETFVIECIDQNTSKIQAKI